MPAIDPPSEIPAPVYPYPYSTLHLFKSKRELDPHFWAPVVSEGGVSTTPLACTPVASPYDFQTCLPGDQKSAPQRATRDTVTAEPQWFEVALTESTIGCASVEDMRALAKKSLEAQIVAAIDTEVGSALNAVANIRPEAPTILCAQIQAIDALAATQGDGRGLISASAGVINYLTEHGSVRDVGGVLRDSMGNVYRTLRMPVPGLGLFYENESLYEVWTTDTQYLPTPPDEIRDRNSVVVRAEAGYLLLMSLCGAGFIPIEGCEV